MPICTLKHVAPLRQYHLAYSPGHFKVWNVIFGLGVDGGSVGAGVVVVVRGLGTVRLVQASVNKEDELKFLTITCLCC